MLAPMHTTTETETTAHCVACGKPSPVDFCARAECLSYGSGAVAAGPTTRSVTRTEHRVLIRTPLGNVRTEWASDERRVEQLRAKYDVVGVELAAHELDY